MRRIFLLTDGFAADAGDALQWGQQANQSGISISTMGLGAEFNDALLIALADDSGGQAYLIEEPAGMAAIFAEELAAARTVALRSLALKLKLYGGVELRHAFRVRPTIGDLGTPVLPDGSVVLPLGDLQADAPPAVLLELVVPPRPPGRYRLAQASLAHAAWDGRAGSEVNADLVVEVRSHVDEASAGNPQVLNLAETVNVFRLQTRALVDAQQGNIAAATMKLRAAATRLLGLGQEELAQAALREAETLDQEGRLSGSGTKKLRYETRKLTQRLD